MYQESFLPIISEFNNVPNARLMKDSDVITIHFKEYHWENKFLSTLQNFEKIIYDKSSTTRPFIKALKKYYRTEDLATVLLLNSNTGYLQQNILIGNNKLLVPAESEIDGDIHLVLTPLFCRKIDQQLKKLTKYWDDTYFYKSHVLFLDPHQLPYRGGSYYDTGNIDEGGARRICLITKDLKDISDNFFPDIFNLSTCLRSYYYTKPSLMKLPDLFHLQLPVESVNFEETNIIFSDLITKTYSNQKPDFLLQDILNSYHSKFYNEKLNPFPLNSVALYIEYPILLDYREFEFSFACGYTVENSPRYYLFFVNSSNPKKVIRVKHPYDRYFVYENMSIEKAHSNNAMIFYYIPNHEQHVPYDLKRVIIGNVTVGYKYENKFLCLHQPLLINSPRTDDDGYQNSDNYNTDCLLNIFTKKDFTNNIRIKILAIYNYDERYDIYKVNHVGCRNDAWCIVSKSPLEHTESCSRESSFVPGDKRPLTSGESDDEPVSKYFRRAPAPLTSFVRAWVDFFIQNIDKKSNSFGNLNIFKLAILLARHKICFKMRTAPNRYIGLLGRREYIFYMDQPAINFVNNVRLVTTTEEDDNEEREIWCTIS